MEENMLDIKRIRENFESGCTALETVELTAQLSGRIT